MDEVTLKDFRCFHEEQTTRLAPLTVLVGDNSTGKTSFLAIIRALWDACNKQHIPNFKDPPYDLGSFYEIAHYRGAGGGRATTFEAGFKALQIEFRMQFKASRSAPAVYSRSLRDGSGNSIEETANGKGQRAFRLTTRKGSWAVELPGVFNFSDSSFVVSMEDLYRMLILRDGFRRNNVKILPAKNSPRITRKDKDTLSNMLFVMRVMGGKSFAGRRRKTRMEERPFSNAPFRSKPQRTYDPASMEQDAEGDYIPTYLAEMHSQDPDRWESLKKQIEDFGKNAGLFNEINIKQLGRRGGEPFQVQIRKFGGLKKNAPKGPQRNLIDVGYGVSQVLPVVTELLHRDSPSMFLLQNPEVHLHPSAQAAIGDLFCQVVGQKGHQIVVETHSDYLLDRIRMAIRHGSSQLKSEDISILFFENQGLDVRIHSLRLDEQGSITNAPAAYRKFFMEEEYRRLRGLGDVCDT